MAKASQDTREKILDAATAIAFEQGPSNVSLDAVAARAGVSKGGLLYHFPSKSKLLQSVVSRSLETYDAQLNARVAASDNDANALLLACLDLALEDYLCGHKPPAGVLAAMAEDPSFLDPVRAYENALLTRLKEESSDTGLALACFYATRGVKCAEVMGFGPVEPSEVEELIGRLRQLVGEH